MKKELIYRVFAALQKLEQHAEFVSTHIESQKKTSEAIAQEFPQHLEVLKKMRLCANRLQLSYARRRWNETVRLLNIFYGLHAMVRTDLMQASASLTSNCPGMDEQFDTVANYH